MPDYINANGVPYTEEEVNAAAQRDGISVDDVLSKNGLTLPDTPDPAEVDELNSIDVETPQSVVVDKNVELDLIPTTDQLKEGVSFFTAERDFVNNMNDRYKNTSISFIQGEVDGKDQFKMYDAKTGEYSEIFDVPNMTRRRAYRDAPYDQVSEQMSNFFARNKKKNEAQLQLDKDFNKQSNIAKEELSNLLEDEDFMTDVLGEDYDFTWIQRATDGGKSGVGNDDDYSLLTKALKEKIGDMDGGIAGLFKSYVPQADIPRIGEQDLEYLVKGAVNKQFQNTVAKNLEADRFEFAELLEVLNLTTTQLDEATKAVAVGGFNDLEKAIYESNQRLTSLEPNSEEYKAELKKNDELLEENEKFLEYNTQRLIDPITRQAINPESEQADGAVTITKEEEDEIIKTYGDNVETAFNANGRTRFLLDKQGKEKFNVTINDPQALDVLKQLGYEVTGENDLGYEMDVELRHLSRYYDATVKSDGFSFMPSILKRFNLDEKDKKETGEINLEPSLTSQFMGAFGITDKPNQFSSPSGYFGLTEKSGEQTFTLAEQRLFDEDEYSDDDKSKAFKRLLKDHREKVFNNVKEGDVLAKMHLLNIDPASTKEALPTGLYETAAEGFNAMFGESQVDADAKYQSARTDRDILETILNNTDIKATEFQKERFKRSRLYRVAEGVAGFVPAIAEFALIDVALKKTGAITGATKLLSKLKDGTKLEKAAYHTYMGLREEFKMSQAFEEHYHQGGGVGFYAIGAMMPKFVTGSNLLNTFITANKSGLAGALSTQAAAQLEALVRDVKGKETYQTFIKENYGDLGLKSEDFLVDYFVFAAVGAKGFANKNFKNYFRTVSKLQALEKDLRGKRKEYKAIVNDKVSNKGAKDVAQLKLNDVNELLPGISGQLNMIYKTADFQDPVKLKKILDRQKDNIEDIYGEEVIFDVRTERTDKEGKDVFEYPDSAAEFRPGTKGKPARIIVDVNRVTEGKTPHEVFHLVMNKTFENNPEQLTMFKQAIVSSFPGKYFTSVDVKDKDGKLTGEKKSMTIEELIENEHGKEVESLKANEFLAYTVELLANPRFYATHTQKNTWGKIKNDLNLFANKRFGQNIFENHSKQDMIDFMYNFSRSVKSGTLTMKQINMFKKLKEDGTFGEPIEADSRTAQRKREQASEDYSAPSKVVEMSAETQASYESNVKGKTGRELERGIENFIMPDFTNETSVAGKQFDGLIYDVIQKLYPRISESASKRYNLAVDLVYDTNRPNPQTSKNRGLIGIVNEYAARKEYITTQRKQKDGSVKDVKEIYDSEGNKRITEEKVQELEKKYDAKFGTKEFIDQANAEGYKGKQNITKTVGQTLKTRIHEIVDRSGLTESELQAMDFGKSIDNISEAELADLGGGVVEAKTPKQKTKQERIDEYKLENKLDLTKYELFENNENLIAETGAAAVKFLTEAKIEDIRRETYKDTYKKYPKAYAEFKKQFGETFEDVKNTFESKGKDLFKGIILDKDYATGETVSGVKATFNTLFEGKGKRLVMSEFGDLARAVRTPKQLASGPERFEKIEAKGENVLFDKIYGDGRKQQQNTRAERAMQFLFEGYFNQTTRLNKLNNPSVVEMLKKKNPGIYEGLGFERVLNQLKSNLEGTIPKSMASVASIEILGSELSRKIKRGTSARAAVLEIIAKNEDLRPYKDRIISEMGLAVESIKTTGEALVKVGEASRKLGLIKGQPFKPLVFGGGFKGKKGELHVYDLVNKFAEDNNIPKELLNINKDLTERSADVNFSKKYAEVFIPDFLNTFDARVINAISPALRYTAGEGLMRLGYRPMVDYVSKGVLKGKRPLIFNAEMGKGIIEGVKGVKDKLPKGVEPNFIKVNDNVPVKNLVEKTLQSETFSDISTSKGKKKIAKHIMEKLSPDGTVKGYNKMVESNEGMLKYAAGKIFDYLNNAKTIEQKAEAINNIAFMLQSQSSQGKGIFRGLASHTAITLKSVLPTAKKKYHSEHEFQLANFTGNMLVSALRNTGNKAKFTSEMEAMARVYKQSIIEKTLQERIDKGGNTTSVYSEKFINTDVTAKYEFLKEREIMESTLDLKSGKTWDQIADNMVEGGAAMKTLEKVTKELAIRSKKAGLPSKNVTTTEMINNIITRDKAVELGRKKNKKARGMSTFDFDDTLATTKSGIRYEMPNPSGEPQPGRKAILIAGNAGAGKTTIIDQLGLRKQGFKYVNQDIALEWLTKNSGLPKNMNEFTREQADKWRDIGSTAAVAAKNKAYKLQGKGDGVVIDGTGSVGVQFQSMARDFKDAGYDVQVVFIESSLENAIARNKGRSERRLTDATIRNSVVDAQKNKKAFREMVTFFPYSAKGFVELNTDNLKQGGPLPAEFVNTMDNFTKGYIKGRINAEQFASEGAKLLEQGAKYDFSEFNKVVEGAPGPLMGKAIERAKKFGNKDMFVLTARPAESAGPIREFLKSQGLDIPLENITGLGNSTGEAKAMWMLKKFSEGYNDMYFVDDAMQNVKAVKNVLDQLDIKSSVQQALASKNVNLEVNEMMEYSLDIKSNKTFSKAEAAVRGKDIKRRRVFMTDSAADLELLLEPLYGKGKKGIENKKWFEENFTRTWERGINDFNNARQAITNDYMNLRKQNKDIIKQLPKAVEGTNFTTDMAIRTYIWNKAGYKIPDLTPTSQAKLVKHVIDNPNLRSYAEKVARLTRVEGGLKEPSAQWWGETLATEIQDLGKGIGRKKYIQEFIDAKNEIFSEENLNKMESKLGTNWRSNIEEMFSRMETGRTRSLDLGKTGNAMMNYFNGSTGAIMNFNTRSAALQLISTVNFVNHSFNNPLAAAKAFADQPQYWKDFMTIMNSDMLKQRRAGLEINVTEAELAAAAASSKNPAKAVIAKILKAGYLPTKVADSFAIASGGATYYRNAIKMYEKQGLSKAEAERKAFIDFQAIAERTQQSSRADLLSNQQTSFAGRVILPFANTSMQMNRIMVKEVLDISKGRYKGYYGEGSLTNKLSKIGYYGFAQSAIFAGLQSGAFALMTNSDDEKLVADAKLRSLNTMADSFLRGMGIQGAVLNGFRLAIKEFIKQDAKKYNADYSEIAEKLLNISPTVGSKFSKLDQAGNTYNYNKKVIKNEGLTLNGPLMETSTQVIEATTNLPLNRYYRKGNNVLNALDDDYENWQRILMGLGWSNWGLGVGDPKVVNKGKENEFTKYRTKEDLRREQQDKEVREFEKSKKNGITNNAWGGGW